MARKRQGQPTEEQPQVSRQGYRKAARDFQYFVVTEAYLDELSKMPFDSVALREIQQEIEMRDVGEEQFNAARSDAEHVLTEYEPIMCTTDDPSRSCVPTVEQLTEDAQLHARRRAERTYNYWKSAIERGMDPETAAQNEVLETMNNTLNNFDLTHPTKNRMLGLQPDR